MSVQSHGRPWPAHRARFRKRAQVAQHSSPGTGDSHEPHGGGAMKLRVALVSAAMICLIALSNVIAVPNLISYQGVLTDSSGTPVNGTVSITFSIYDVATGGTALWSETQAVTATNGIFNVQLGAVEPIPHTVFVEDQLYLGLKAGADQEMSPRQMLSSTGYAMKAETLAFRGRRLPSPWGAGKDGEFVSSGTNSLTRGRVYEFTSFTLQAGHSITATGGSSPAEPIVIRVAGDCEIDGFIDLSGAGMPGGSGAFGGNTAGVDVPDTLGGGEPGGYSNGSGGGGGAGGAGTGAAGGGGGGAAGAWLFQAGFDLKSALVGAGGGGGGGGSSVSGGHGGAGGGAIIVFVGGTTIISGVINVKGGDGSGGASATCSGCRGGGGGGGGGGGAIVVVHAGTFDDTGATYLYSGGSGGNGGSGPGGNGSTGGVGGTGKVVVPNIDDL